MSRHHARGEAVRGKAGIEWHVEDLGSANGTFVDGRRMRQDDRVQLAHGSRVRFGRAGPCFRAVDERLYEADVCGWQDHLSPPHKARGAKAASTTSPYEIAGNLHVEVMEGRNLQETQAVFSQDPFVALMLDPWQKKLVRTRCHSAGGRNPTWFRSVHDSFWDLRFTGFSADEAWTTPNRKGSSTLRRAILEVRCHNQNALRGNQFIGGHDVDLLPFLRPLLHGVRCDVWVPIYKTPNAQTTKIVIRALSGCDGGVNYFPAKTSLNGMLHLRLRFVRRGMVRRQSNLNYALGRVSEALRVKHPQLGAVHLHILRATLDPTVSKGDTPTSSFDLFYKVTLMERIGKERRQFATKGEVIFNTVAPHFDQKLVLPVYDPHAVLKVELLRSRDDYNTRKEVMQERTMNPLRKLKKTLFASGEAKAAKVKRRAERLRKAQRVIGHFTLSLPALLEKQAAASYAARGGPSIIHTAGFNPAKGLMALGGFPFVDLDDTQKCGPDWFPLLRPADEQTSFRHRAARGIARWFRGAGAEDDQPKQDEDVDEIDKAYDYSDLVGRIQLAMSFKQTIPMLAAPLRQRTVVRQHFTMAKFKTHWTRVKNVFRGFGAWFGGVRDLLQWKSPTRTIGFLLLQTHVDPSMIEHFLPPVFSLRSLHC